MEHENNILVCLFAGDWNDVGSWDSIASLKKVSSKKDNIIELETNDNFIRNDKRLIVTIGTKKPYNN